MAILVDVRPAAGVRPAILICESHATSGIVNDQVLQHIFSEKNRIVAWRDRYTNVFYTTCVKRNRHNPLRIDPHWDRTVSITSERMKEKTDHRLEIERDSHSISQSSRRFYTSNRAGAPLINDGIQRACRQADTRCL